MPISNTCVRRTAARSAFVSCRSCSCTMLTIASSIVAPCTDTSIRAAKTCALYLYFQISRIRLRSFLNCRFGPFRRLAKSVCKNTSRWKNVLMRLCFLLEKIESATSFSSVLSVLIPSALHWFWKSKTIGGTSASVLSAPEPVPVIRRRSVRSGRSDESVHSPFT